MANTSSSHAVKHFQPAKPAQSSNKHNTQIAYHTTANFIAPTN